MVLVSFVVNNVCLNSIDILLFVNYKVNDLDNCNVEI